MGGGMGQSSLCLPSRVAEEGGARDQGAATEKGACRVRGGPTYHHRVAAGKRLHCAWATTRE
jgi:hypothetical protein